METFHPRIPIDATKTYKVDKFLMKFQSIGGEHTFLPGGRYFVMLGKQLKLLVEQSMSFEDDETTECAISNKKKNVCFLSVLNSRDTIIAHYKRVLFNYHSKPTKSLEAFNNLCIKVRNKRYNNRLTFNYFVVKRLQCIQCQNKCVYEALRKFYNMESKCVNQVDRLIAQEHERGV
uniref:Late expression factor 2 n=1 Tax=Erinnyis ello granulovirus TaxID=307444 RepID=A0A288WHH0_9BBAC|nr:late expression factor 2 [Erinnyis ello granulovirus]ARX71503.1 late expression factor 2 [Erinnyis ello granulovirus]